MHSQHGTTDSAIKPAHNHAHKISVVLLGAMVALVSACGGGGGGGGGGGTTRILESCTDLAMPILDGNTCRAAESAVECRANYPARPLLDGGTCVAATTNAQCEAAHSTFPIQDGGGCRMRLPRDCSDTQEFRSNRECTARTAADCETNEEFVSNMCELREASHCAPTEVFNSSNRTCVSMQMQANCTLAMPVLDGGRCRPQQRGDCPSAAMPIANHTDNTCRAAVQTDCTAAMPVLDGTACRAQEAGDCAVANMPIANHTDGTCRAAAGHAECRDLNHLTPIHSNGSCMGATTDEECRDTYPMQPVRGTNGACQQRTNETCAAADTTMPIVDIQTGECRGILSHADCAFINVAMPVFDSSDNSCGALENGDDCVAVDPTRPIFVSSTTEGNSCRARVVEDCTGTMPILNPETGECEAAESRSANNAEDCTGNTPEYDPVNDVCRARNPNDTECGAETNARVVGSTCLSTETITAAQRTAHDQLARAATVQPGNTLLTQSVTPCNIVNNGNVCGADPDDYTTEFLSLHEESLPEESSPGGALTFRRIAVNVDGVSADDIYLDKGVDAVDGPARSDGADDRRYRPNENLDGWDYATYEVTGVENEVEMVVRVTDNGVVTETICLSTLCVREAERAGAQIAGATVETTDRINPIEGRASLIRWTDTTDEYYLAGGVWAIDPLAHTLVNGVRVRIESRGAVIFPGLSDLTLRTGSTVDSPYPEPRHEVGEATYSGHSFGHYSTLPAPAGATSSRGFFAANATLTANFDTQQVSGTISNFLMSTDNTFSDTAKSPLEDALDAAEFSVTLRPTALSNAPTALATFRGTTFAVAYLNGARVALEGLYGGQLYEPEGTPLAPEAPDAIAGTWSAAGATTSGGGFGISFLGAFGAHKD